MDNFIGSEAFMFVGGGLALVLLVVLGGLIVQRRRHPRLSPDKFRVRWQDIQRQCIQADTWPEAITNADKLLDEALKKARFKGQNMGERLVAAQRHLSDNDGVWFGHKLSNKIVHQEMQRLYKKDVQSALRGLRQALHDLGAVE